MPAFLLHVASKISMRSIDSAVDQFERESLTKPHYLLGRSGHCANYIITSDERPEVLHGYLSEQAAKRFALEWVSMVEILRPWEVIEPAIAMPPGWTIDGDEDEEWPAVLEDDSLASVDHCGELQRARTEDSYFHPELIRVRTGLRNWLDVHAPHGGGKAKDDANSGVALLLHFHHSLGDDGRWLKFVRGRFGRSCRPFMHDNQSILLAWHGVSARDVFQQPRFQSVLRDNRVQSAFCFKVGQLQVHTGGVLQSVVPAPHGPERKGPRPSPMPPKKPTLVVSRNDNVVPVQLREALAKLRDDRAKRGNR